MAENSDRERSPLYTLDIVGGRPSLGLVDMSGSMTLDAVRALTPAGVVRSPHDWPDVSLLTRPGVDLRRALELLRQCLPWALGADPILRELYGETPAPRDMDVVAELLGTRMLVG